MRKIFSILIVLLACSLILPIISATPFSDLGYTSFKGNGNIAFVGKMDIGLVKGDGYFVVPAGTQVNSLTGDLTSLSRYKSYFENYTIEGYSIKDIDVYILNGVVYVQDVEFLGFRGNTLNNNGGIITNSIIEHYADNGWTQQ